MKNFEIGQEVVVAVVKKDSFWGRTETCCHAKVLNKNNKDEYLLLFDGLVDTENTLNMSKVAFMNTLLVPSQYIYEHFSDYCDEGSVDHFSDF